MSRRGRGEPHSAQSASVRRVSTGIASAPSSSQLNHCAHASLPPSRPPSFGTHPSLSPPLHLVLPASHGRSFFHIAHCSLVARPAFEAATASSAQKRTRQDSCGIATQHASTAPYQPTNPPTPSTPAAHRLSSIFTITFCTITPTTQQPYQHSSATQKHCTSIHTLYTLLYARSLDFARSSLIRT